MSYMVFLTMLSLSVLSNQPSNAQFCTLSYTYRLATPHTHISRKPHLYPHDWACVYATF